jgi:hypothetical protein
VEEIEVGKIVLVQPSKKWAKEELKRDPEIDLKMYPWIAEVK